MQSINNLRPAINYSHGRWKVEGGGEYESTGFPFSLRNISEAGRQAGRQAVRVQRNSQSGTYVHSSLSNFWS